MTTFFKNPYAELRKKINSKIFYFRLDQRLEHKFKHKQFSERFAIANTAFIGMGFIAQFASLTTAFTMLSYLFVNINIIARLACSIALVLMIEVIKRESTNDVMKGIFQYKEIERSPTLLALIAVGGSIYISVEGAKILPSLLIDDPVKIKASLGETNVIQDLNERIAEEQSERDKWRETRKYQKRLSRKDALLVKEHNEEIKVLQNKKDEALKELKQENQAAQLAVQLDFKNAIKKVKQDRTKLGKQLVTAAVVFELLFLLSLCFSWWYDTECRKERQQSNTDAVQEENSSPTHKPKSKEIEDLELETVGVRATKKVSFKDYETEQPNTTDTKVKKTKKDYTRICPQCGAPFIHKTHNHTYCSRSCMIAARERRNAKK